MANNIFVYPLNEKKHTYNVKILFIIALLTKKGNTDHNLKEIRTSLLEIKEQNHYI